MHEVAEELDPYLSQLSLGQLEDLYASIANYKEKPVCIEEFLDSDKYLGAYWNGDLYGYWRNFLKEVYPSPFFSPYWLISLRGSIGQGKCLDSDTRVPTSLGIKCIKDLYALWSSGSRFQVLSESGPKEVSFMVSDGIKPCRTISTIKGAKVTVGDNHRFRVLHPTTGAILWKKASDLCQGDKILRTLRPSPVGNKVLLPNFAWFVGVISGDGGISVLKNGDRVVIHFIMNAVDIKDDNYRESIEKGFSEFAGGFNNWYLSRNCFATRKVSRSLASYLLSQGFLGKEQNEGGRLPKLVPEFIFEASAADQVEYIAGVVDTDGHLSTHMAAIEISNSSECFIRGLASICSALGLLVRVTPKHFVNCEHVYWRLSIHNYRSFRRLAELNFRPRLVYKQQAFAELLASKDSGSNVRLPLVGFSPILRQLDQRLRESGVKTQARNVRSVWGMVSNQTTTLDSVQRIASTFKTGGLVRDFDFVNDFQCYTDEVRSIETVNREVYDLSVADDPSYVFDGFISHNTSVACAGLAYDIYKLILMNAPQESFGLVRSTKILFAIFNRTLSLTTDVVWDKLSQMFVQSPFFYQFVGVFGSKKKRSFGSDDTLFPNRVDFIMGSRMGHALGQAIHSAIISEANFEVIEGQTYKTFNSVLRRMESRFIGSDGIPGKIWIDSSETDKFSAVNKIVDSYRRSQGVKVSQAAVWDVKPHRYGTARFWVFKGSDVKQPELLQLDSPILISEPENCIQVPTEHKDAFEADTVEALRDLAGIATGSKYRLFRLKDRLTKAVAVSPLFPDKFQLDFDDDNDQISNYCLVKNYFLNPLNKGYPRNIHLDIGLSGDRLGIAGSYVTKFRDRIYRDISTFQEVSESVPEVVCEWCIGIEPKNGKQVPLFKIRAFIQWLSSVGYPVGRITSDGFQSAEMIQLLTKMGFTAELLSMDKTSTPYTEVRNALYEGRVMVPQNKLLKEELENLEVTPDGTKVDHQPDGSKDLADAACGSIYTAMIDASKIRLMHYVEKKQSVGTENLQNIFWNEG